MIVQCEACETRFRLADEKIKPGGTKVRCSKCKEVFTVTLPEPEPDEEVIDFGSFNMEKLSEDVSAETEPAATSFQEASPKQEQQPTPPESEDDSSTESGGNNDLDFSGLASEMGGEAGAGEELADHFSFADTSKPGESALEVDDTESDYSAFSVGEIPQEESSDEDPPDFIAAFEETEEPGGPSEFEFSEETEFDAPPLADKKEEAVSAEEPAGFAEFSFDNNGDEQQEPNESGEFSFDDEGDSGAFKFDEVEETAVADGAQALSGPDGEFSFDEDDSSFTDDAVATWSDEPAGDDISFNFDEPEFGTDNAPDKAKASSAQEGGLQFGEIDFSNENDESSSPSFPSDVDFSKAPMPLEKEEEPFSQSRLGTPPPSRDLDDEPLPAPPPAPPKKSPLSRIVVLLVILLIGLGGAAGFLFMQEGTLNLNIIAKYLPFLQKYIGEAPVTAPGDRIGINIEGSSYVNGKAGQMLVIQGTAVNNHSTTRSAITVKGSLLDAKGQILLQQTVFCGNKLDEAKLKTMPFDAIEEAMNNQFGEGLSNMNVAVKASIPFTIVFRKLPVGIANINVEVVDSKPGAS